MDISEQQFEEKISAALEEYFAADRVWKKLQTKMSAPEPKPYAPDLLRTEQTQKFSARALNVFGKKSFAFGLVMLVVATVTVGSYRYTTLKQIPAQTKQAPGDPAVVALGVQASAGLSENNHYSVLPIALSQPEPIPIDDVREIFKTSFGATIETSTVAELATRARTIIRGHGGRVDTMSVNEENANIVFVIPREEYSAFEQELTAVAGEKFIHINEYSQNLLTEQRNLENSIREAEKISDPIAAANQINFLREQEKKFNEKTNTITGAISIEHIGVIGVITTYISVGWFAAGIILVIIWRIWRHKKQNK